MSNYDYDLFVIGAGSGGVRAARISAGHGAKVGIAEYQAFGGTCVNVGCVPKKLMAYAADYGDDFEDATGFGWSEHKPVMDWGKLISRKNAEIERLNGIYERLLNNAGVTIHLGRAKFVDAHTLDIDGTRVTAERILIAAGGVPRAPTYDGAEHVMTSDDFFYMEEQPKSIVIEGGGYIAVEMAHILNGMGTDVHLVYRGPTLLKLFDHDISRALMAEMEKQNIHMHLETEIDSVKSDGAGLKVHTNKGDVLSVDKVLSATGRVANTEALNLAQAGVEARRNGTIEVNEKYETNIPHIYAIGDIANNHNLTPVATAEGHALADRLFAGMSERVVSYDNIATAVFSKPNIGTIGYTEQQAREAGIDVQIFKSDFKPMVHTLSGRDERTFMKLIVDRSTDKVIGCHMMGLYAAEIMQGFAVAIKAGATKADFDRTIGIHPTSAEEFVTMRTAVEG